MRAAVGSSAVTVIPISGSPGFQFAVLLFVVTLGRTRAGAPAPHGQNQKWD